MQFGQWWRRFLRGLRGRRAGDEGPIVERMDAASFSSEPSVGEAAGGAVRWIIIIAVVLALLYYPVGSMLDHEVRDDPDWAPATPPDGASQAVAVASGLITREVDQVGWVANTPPLAPNALLKYGGNMMNFQVGITTAIGLFTIEMRDRIGRARGSSEADADLINAASKIQWEADNWVFRWGSLLPQAAAEDEYREVRDALTTYNTRLARGDAVFDARADNLLAVLDRFALDIGSLSAQTEQRIATGRRSFPLDRRADKHYYKVKGHAYAYAQLLAALRVDFADIIDSRAGVAGPYDEMTADLALIGSTQPLVVMNGAPTGMSANNHLAVQGFYLLRARAKMREITDILAK